VPFSETPSLRNWRDFVQSCDKEGTLAFNSSFLGGRGVPEHFKNNL